MEKLFTCKDVAERYQLTVGAIYRLIKDGKLNCVKLGGSRNLIRFRESDLIAFEKGGEQQ